MHLTPAIRLGLFALFLLCLRPARAEQVVFSEIMYNPPANKPEYIEIWNISRTPLDMGKWRFTDGITYEYPDFAAATAQAAFLKAGERILLSSADESTTRAAYPSIPANVRVFGPFTGSLANEGERVTLSDRNGVPICTVNYKDESPWPKAADGAGHSLILRNENRMIDDFRVWSASFRTGGSPGVADTGAPLSSPVRLSEAHLGANNAIDWIELQNATEIVADAASVFIASRADLSDKVQLSGSVPANGYASFDVNFPVAADGGITLYLLDNASNVIATAELKLVAGRPSMQAVYPITPARIPSWEYLRLTPTWYSSPTDTRNAANDPPIQTGIVINEIMYDLPASHAGGEFIELYNKSSAPVDLTGWRIRGGVDFDFPAGTILNAGSYLVVVGSKEYMAQAYPGVAVLGDWSGSLKNDGDQIRVIDNFGNLADEVDYRPGGDWPLLAAGQGSSMELVHPDMDNSRASAWRDSNESQKTQWQTFTYTGPFQQLRADGVPTDYKELHFHLVGDSYVQLRNIKLGQGTAGANILTNVGVQSTNGSSATGWLMQGTHWASFIDGSGVLNLISDGHGDNRANRAEIDATALTAGQTYTLQFEARWVSGKSRLIAQTWDHSFGKAFLLPIPNNLGTPGAPNSIASAAPLPQVDSVLHSPAVPKSTDPVRVTARVISQTPLAAVEVVHRADSSTNTNAWASTPMVDDGTAGDAVANDGVYTATLTEHQVNGRIVQFYVRATAANGGGTAELPKGGASRPALWIVDSRAILTSSDLRKQRLIIPAQNRDALVTTSGESARFGYDFPRLSNHYFNATFIHNEADVYYNAEIRKSGSPWTRADTSVLDRGKWKLPGDRMFRNRDKFTFDNDATGAARHHNRLIRYWLYLLGHPVNENEFVTQTINLDAPVVREDVEPVDGALISRNFPDGNKGQLLRSDDEWWFQDNWSRNNRDADWSYKGTDEPIRYHTEWMARSRENEYDYSSFTELCRTVTNPSSSEELLNRVLDPQMVLMMAAVRGYAYDWDSFTLTRGKNGFMYRKPTDGRWIFLHWDSDLAFQDASNIVTGTRTGWVTYISKPWTRRIFNYYLTEMLTKLTKGSARVNAWFDAEEASSTAYTVDKNFYLNWFSTRESRIIQEINSPVGGPSGSYSATFAVTSPAAGSTTTSATVNVGGTAPARAFKVVVDGQPQATLRWVNQTQWTISGVVLKSGANTVSVRMEDREGNTLATISHVLNRDGNAPPVIQFSANPGSYNVKLGEAFTIDASSSFDPDGGTLDFTSSVDSTTGVSIFHPSPARTDAVFSQPGVYTLTVAGTDTGGAKTEDSREILVYHAQDFSPMNAERLEPHWTLQNVNERDNFANSAWYSTQDVKGTLLVQVLSDVAKPTNPTAPTHPLITRALPTTGDFALQTDLYLAARQTGSFFTGLYIETVEDGATARYLYGLENGTLLTVKRSAGGAAYTNVTSQSSTGGSAVLRVRRVGNELRFQRRIGDVWATATSVQAMPQGATAVRGGVFVATTVAQDVRVGFDYIALADSSRSSTPVRDSLRITEIMYNPKAPDTVEFIELQNTGTEPINLQGVRFDDGAPVEGMTFGDETLAPGEYIAVTNSVAAFRARYGDTPRLAGQWSAGNLSNSGERIILRDADGSIILDFTYSDVAPWPTAADGGGRSLEFTNTAANYNDPASWSASLRLAGSPGRSGANVPPVAVNDLLHPQIGTSPLPLNVLANDSDPDGDAPIIVELGTPEHGSVVTDGSVIHYEPGPTFTGNDTFSYKISDGVNGTATATVTLQNASPTALPDTLHIPWSAGALVLNVQENDSDTDGDLRTIVAVGNGTHGIASTDGNTVTYSPGDSFTGSDSFTYTISDQHGGISTSTVTLVNSAPVAVNDSATTDGTAVTIGVLGNDTDADGDVLSLLSVTAGSHGTTAIDGSSVIYTPDTSYQGNDSFSYSISDGYGGKVTAVVSIRNAGVLTRTAAETGTQVPGAPLGTTYLSLQVPAVGDDDSLAWVSRVRMPGSKQPKLMLIGGNPARALLTQGDPVPDLPGARFTKFSAPVCDDAGRIVFVAGLTGAGIPKKERSGIFATQPDGSTTTVARLGAPAVGLSGSTLSSFVAVDADGGETLYVAKTAGGKQAGVWAWDGTTTRLVAATGTQLTTETGVKTISAVDLLRSVSGSPGHDRSHRAGSVTLRLTFSDKTQAIGYATLEADAWSTKVQVLSGQTTDFGGTWKSFGPPALGADGSAVLIGNVSTGGKRTEPTLAVFGEDGPSEIIRAGNSGSANTILQSFMDPVANADGALAFTARVSGAGIRKNNATGLFLVPPGGDLTLIAAPGQPTGADTGTVWDKVLSYALPQSNNSAPLFLATFSGSGVNKKNNLGLWTRNADGTPLMLARTGQTVPGLSTPKVISKLTLLNALPPVHGSARSFNAARSVAYLVTFTNGSQAIQVQRLP